MYGHRSRLNHCSVLRIHPDRQLQYFRSSHTEVFSTCASGLETHDLQLVADVVRAVSARIAAAACHLRLKGHQLARGEVIYRGSHAFDDPRHLMSLDNCVGRERVPTIIDMNVGPANTDSLDSQKDLGWTRNWNRHVTKLNHSGGGHD